MIEGMIKICSLDFLNRESFETDVMTAEGNVLFKSGEKITPNILLRLYFKEIYIKEALKEQLSAEASTIAVGIVADEKTAMVGESSNKNTTQEEQIKSAEPRSIESGSTEDVENATKGPRLVDSPIKEEKELSSGPKSVNIENSEESADGSKKGPKLADINKMDNVNEKNNEDLVLGEKSDKEAEVENEDPDNMQLVFDENQASRIVEYSLKLGKLLKFSANDLKELEQVAYYCNIGISEFKKSDLSKKGFRKMKAFASYEKLLSEKNVSEKIAEMVKFCANNYESDAFPLNSQIPFHQIVAITSFYEELLMQNNSKQTTLLKMLQIGGNQFNIFILHKFIKMMRETND